MKLQTEERRGEGDEMRSGREKEKEKILNSKLDFFVNT